MNVVDNFWIWPNPLVVGGAGAQSTGSELGTAAEHRDRRHAVHLVARGRVRVVRRVR